MKKIMMMALMAIVATTAFAGDSPTLKSILKAKTYAEAEGLLKSGLNQLASPAEKAKAYNKLVDLALDKVTKEQAIETGNQMAQQMGNGKIEQFDTLGYYTALVNAFDAAENCEKYDVMPDAKGKVKPAFHKKNVDRLIGHRAHLVNGAQYFQDHQNNEQVFALLAKYVDTHDSPLFAEDIAKTGDPSYEPMALNAARFAYFANNLENVKKYAAIAASSKEEDIANDAIVIKNEAFRKALNTKQDTINFINELKEDLVKYPKSDYVLEQLLTNLTGIGKADEARQIIDKTLAADPNNFVGWVYKGNLEYDQKQLEQSAESLKKALTIRDNVASIWAFRGRVLIEKAEEVSDQVTKNNRQIVPGAAKQILPFYEEAKVCLEKAKELDPDQAQSQWKYLLEENCVYNIEALSKIANQ